MVNNVVLVGRLTKDIELDNIDDRINTRITLAIPRSYKNPDGIYDTDFVEVILWNNIASNTAEYCRKGDLVGIKGRLQTENIFDENSGTHKQVTTVVAEKVTFLSAGR